MVLPFPSSLQDGGCLWRCARTFSFPGQWLQCKIEIKKRYQAGQVAYCRAEWTEGVADVEVDLTGVRLRADFEDAVEASFLGDQVVELLYFRVISLEQSKESALRASSPRDTLAYIEVD